jgi:hypothetical protein
MVAGRQRFGDAGYSFRVLIDALYSRRVHAGPMS